jgi:hypothetical protein
VSARNSHTLGVIDIAYSQSGGVDSFLVLFGGASPELGPLGDTYYAALPSGGIPGDLFNFYCFTSLNQCIFLS